MIRIFMGYIYQLPDSFEYLFQFVCCSKVLIIVGTFFSSFSSSGFICTIISCRLFFRRRVAGRSFCLNFWRYWIRSCFHNLSWQLLGWLRFSNNNWSFDMSGFWLRNRIWLVRLLLNYRCFCLFFRWVTSHRSSHDWSLLHSLRRFSWLCLLSLTCGLEECT